MQGPEQSNRKEGNKAYDVTDQDDAWQFLAQLLLLIEAVLMNVRFVRRVDRGRKLLNAIPA